MSLSLVDIVILAVILAFVAAVIIKSFYDRKKGKLSCGVDCSTCGGCSGRSGCEINQHQQHEN